MGTGIVFDIQRFSLHDGPGIRTTVFFKGCPLNCWWCHNPESQALGLQMMFNARRCIRCGTCETVCAQSAISWNNGVVSTDEKCTLCGVCVESCYAEAREIVGQEMTVQQVMAKILRDVPFYDESGGGVTFSGGEPLLQPDFLLALLRACKEQNIHTAVDTCGYATWKILDSAREDVDLFLYDLKVMDGTKHRRFTGVPNRLILNNLQMLSARGHNITLRVPIIPGINDDNENICQIGAFATESLGLSRVDILPYHHIAVDKYDRLKKVYGLSEIRPPSEKKMDEIAQSLRHFGLEVKIGG